MKYFFTLLLSVFLSLSGYCQSQQQQYLEEVEDQLQHENVKAEFEDFDFSTLMIPKGDFLGYIGDDFRRIKVFYTSIQKDTHNPDLYLVKGVTVVSNNKCDFSGVITIKEIRELKEMKLGENDVFADAGFKAQGVLIADYIFKENPEQSHVGTFEGTMILDWVLSKHNVLHINDIDNFLGGYKNNQHIGTWTQYGSSIPKTCNWGYRRIPFSGDLDIGTGEFSVHPKYKNKDWKYVRAF